MARRCTSSPLLVAFTAGSLAGAPLAAWSGLQRSGRYGRHDVCRLWPERPGWLPATPAPAGSLRGDGLRRWGGRLMPPPASAGHSPERGQPRRADYDRLQRLPDGGRQRYAPMPAVARSGRGQYATPSRKQRQPPPRVPPATPTARNGSVAGELSATACVGGRSRRAAGTKWLVAGAPAAAMIWARRAPAQLAAHGFCAAVRTVEITARQLARTSVCRFRTATGRHCHRRTPTPASTANRGGARRLRSWGACAGLSVDTSTSGQAGLSGGLPSSASSSAMAAVERPEAE